MTGDILNKDKRKKSIDQEQIFDIDMRSGVKAVLPTVKAIMARSIVEKHGLNEKQTADILGCPIAMIQ
jgi:hypothetical protein